MTETPLVSVIIATYYRNGLVRDAIDSALSQEYAPIEVIVVDDSGCGHARPVLEAYDEIKPIYREENGGWGAAYTDGINAASGTYIQLLDDDDWLLPEKLSQCVDVLEEQPAIGVVYTGLIQDTTGRELPDPSYEGDVLEATLRFRTFPCCTITMFLRRSVLLDCLPLSREADDLYLKLCLAQRTPFASIDACLAYRRSQESRKWTGLRRTDEMRRILDVYADLYSGYPAIRQHVRTEIAVREGEYWMEQRIWSIRAIVCFVRATWLAAEGRSRHAIRAISSVFGRPGMSFARWWYNRLSGRKTRRGDQIDG